MGLFFVLSSILSISSYGFALHIAYFNGEMRKVAMCRAKPYELIERIEDKTKNNNNQEETHERIEETRETESDDKIDNIEIEIEEENVTDTEEENENETGTLLKKDKIGAKYLQIEKSIYFMDYQIYS